MKNLVKVLGISSALAVAGSISVCSASAYNYTTVYTTDYLRVREAPSLDAAIIDVVAPDTPVQRICKLDNGWSQVVYHDEVYYMHSDYLIEYEYAEIEDSYYAEADYTEDIEDVVEYEYDTDSYYDEIIAASNFRFDGVEFWGDYRWTYYSEQVLPGGGLDIPGRHTDYNGYVCDENDYICLASDFLPKGYVCDENDYICLASDFLPKGTVVSTPFGKAGKVYDCGCGDNITLDVYVNW